ncbi:unnamed protein product, partial [Rotaria sp. Silwood1]
DNIDDLCSTSFDSPTQSMNQQKQQQSLRNTTTQKSSITHIYKDDENENDTSILSHTMLHRVPKETRKRRRRF